MVKKCVLLLSTYDGGEDLWHGFFTALKTQWPEMNMPVYINTESKDFEYEGFDITVEKVDKNKKIPWGKRLKNVLRKIDSEYVLFFLEDYWLDGRVDNDYFLKTVKWMDENPDIATFSFFPCMPGQNIQDNRFERMELRPQKCEYKLNCQVAIWRRERLIKYIRNHEDPWEWEVWGSQRASRYTELFYTLKDGEELPFSYGDPQVGCLIHRGKWVKEVAEKLADQYSMDIDFSIRGFEDFDKFYEDMEKRKAMTLKEKLREGKAISKAFKKMKNKFRKIKSLL